MVDVSNKRFTIEFSPNKCLYLCSIGLKMQRPEECAFVMHFIESPSDEEIFDTAITHGYHLFHKECQLGGEIVIHGAMKVQDGENREVIIDVTDNKHIEGVPL